MLKFDTFGVTVNLWGLNESLSIEESRMIDAWYLLTFTFLSKELCFKDGCDALLMWFILFIYLSFPNFRDYRQHIFTFL